MPEFDVVVYSRLREIYTVEAGSAEEAEEIWHEGDPWAAEVVELLEVEVRSYVD